MTLISFVVQVPFIFKYAVDGLAASPAGDPLLSTSVLVMTPAALLVGYGVARVTAVGCNELRNAVFAKVWLHICSLVGPGCLTPHSQHWQCQRLWFANLLAVIWPASQQRAAMSFVMPSLPRCGSIICSLRGSGRAGQAFRICKGHSMKWSINGGFCQGQPWSK